MRSRNLESTYGLTPEEAERLFALIPEPQGRVTFTIYAPPDVREEEPAERLFELLRAMYWGLSVPFGIVTVFATPFGGFLSIYHVVVDTEDHDNSGPDHMIRVKDKPDWPESERIFVNFKDLVSARELLTRYRRLRPADADLLRSVLRHRREREESRTRVLAAASRLTGLARR